MGITALTYSDSWVWALTLHPIAVSMTLQNIKINLLKHWKLIITANDVQSAEACKFLNVDFCFIMTANVVKFATKDWAVLVESLEKVLHNIEMKCWGQ